MTKNVSVPEGYKKTELGMIPKEWEVEELVNVCNFFDHMRVPIKKADRVKRCGLYPYYGAQSIIDWIDDYIFDGNYLLIAEDGENLKSKVLPIAYQVSGKFWVNNHAHIIKPKDNCKIGYLEHILNFIDMERYITGSAQPKLNQNTAKKIKIQLPPPDEQQKIASILSKVDEQIEQTEQIIEKTELLKKGLMQKLLTKGIGHTKFKKTELGEIPEEWEIIKLKEICLSALGGGTPTTSKEDYWDGDIPWMTSSHISSVFITNGQKSITIKGLDNSASNLVPKNNLIVATRVGLGKLAVNLIDISISQDLTGLIIDRTYAVSCSKYRFFLTFLMSQ